MREPGASSTLGGTMHGEVQRDVKLVEFPVQVSGEKRCTSHPVQFGCGTTEQAKFLAVFQDLRGSRVWDVRCAGSGKSEAARLMIQQ